MMVLSDLKPCSLQHVPWDARPLSRYQILSPEWHEVLMNFFHLFMSW